jgi:hypothetical protein
MGDDVDRNGFTKLLLDELSSLRFVQSSALWAMLPPQAYFDTKYLDQKFLY